MTKKEVGLEDNKPEDLIKVINDTIVFLCAFEESRFASYSLMLDFAKDKVVEELKECRDRLMLITEDELPKDERIAKVLKETAYMLTKTVFEDTKNYFGRYIDKLLDEEIGELTETIDWLSKKDSAFPVPEHQKLIEKDLECLIKRRKEVLTVIRPTLLIAGEGVDFYNYTSFISVRNPIRMANLEFIFNAKNRARKALRDLRKGGVKE